jgi:adenine-specific DNA-methyltransferase
MQGKDKAKKTIAGLVNNFKDHINEYKKASYNEATLRIDYLNKFLNALEWDVENKENLSPSFREVITEDRVEVEGRTKAPDYSFRLKNGARQFFLESKKPSVNISSHAPSAFQVKRYGWNADIGISILSSFEYLSVYDCSSKPVETQAASFSRLKIIHFEEYLDEFEYIWENFSKEAVLNGSLQKFKLVKNKKGTSSVDGEFLKSLDNWRSALAKNIFNNNMIDDTQLNYAVQKIIDQIIFLRIAEDRDIEPYGALQKITTSQNCYEDFLQICRKANEKYNSGLFEADQLLKNLKLENKDFISMIKDLYFPISPYEFSVLPLDILGKAYEQFLGKVIVIDKKNKLTVTEKPEVKKAGGVFYTPKYIVESIVEDTLGVMIKDSTPEKVKKIKILDPACGSGTFLLTAFEYLLDWYKKYYENGKVKLLKKARDEILTPSGELTTKFKGEILLNNIYGIDVDRNAVEVTKLSLLLKCLEGESKDSLKAQMTLFQERVLPTIDQNIVSGNSLVDFDIYGLSPDLESDLRVKRKINAFNWETHFKTIFKESGGFHVVIGNPPYVRQELFTDLKPYLKTKYEVFNGVADLYTYFFEKSYHLMAPNGLFSIIVANKWFRVNASEQLRKWLKGICIESIKDFGDLPVFENATTYPCIIKIKKSNAQKNFLFSDLIRQGIRNPKEHINTKPIQIECANLNDKGWILADAICLDVISSFKKNSTSLGAYVNGKVHYGIKTGFNQAFVISEIVKNQLIKNSKTSEKLIRPFIEGKDVKAYAQIIPKNYLIFIPKGWTKKLFGNLIENSAFEKLTKNFPAIAKFLKAYENEAKTRYDQGDYWWELRACDYYDAFEKSKIIYPNILGKPEFTYDNEKLYTNQKCFIIPTDDLFLLGVLNSELAYFWFEMYLPKLRGGFYEPSYIIFKNFPVIKLEQNNKNALREKQYVIKNVEKILRLGSKNITKEAQKECLYLKKEINNSVYKLYGIKKPESDHIMEILENVKRK